MICTTAIIVSVFNVVPAGEFQKTILWMVFLTEFHPNGFDPCNSVRIKNRYVSIPARFLLVEMMGIEPTTSALRTLRSPN